MKMRVIDRILAALAGLLLLAIGAGVILVCLNVFPAETVFEFVKSMPQWTKFAIIGGCALIIILGIFGISRLFAGKKSRYVQKETDNGDVSIAITALETLARKCAESHKNVNVKSVTVLKENSEIRIYLNVLVPNGVNLPEVIGMLQKHVRQYVTDCSGIVVQCVTVQVETDPNAKGIPPKLMAGQEEAEAPADEPIIVPEVSSNAAVAEESVQEAPEAPAAPETEPEAAPAAEEEPAANA